MAAQMVGGIHRYLLHEMDKLANERAQLWSRAYTSVEHYEQSIQPNRQRFQNIIGAVDTRVAAPPPEPVMKFGAREWIAQGPGYKVYAIRWRVFDGVTADSDGLVAEGLLLQPEGIPVA